MSRIKSCKNFAAVIAVTDIYFFILWLSIGGLASLYPCYSKSGLRRKLILKSLPLLGLRLILKARVIEPWPMTVLKKERDEPGLLTAGHICDAQGHEMWML